MCIYYNTLPKKLNGYSNNCCKSKDFFSRKQPEIFIVFELCYEHSNMIERFSFVHSPSPWAVVLVLYSVEQSCKNKTFQLCTKGEVFHLKLFFNRKKKKKRADSFRKFKQFPLPRYVFHEFSLISDLVHMCRANNECFQFQSSVSSLPA